MRLRHRGRLRPAARHLLCLGVPLAALAVVGGPSAGTASAACGGSNCPGSGYTLDTVWNCGPIVGNTPCYANGTTIAGNAVSHTYGWGSASFPGTYNCINLGSLGGTSPPAEAERVTSRRAA